MDRPAKSGPTRLGSVLENVVARLGLDRNLDDYRLWQAWDEVVGPAVARNAQPVRIDSRRLVVAVRNNVWMQELSLLRDHLCERLNEWMGRDIVGEIFLVVGKIEPPSRVDPSTQPMRANAPPQHSRAAGPSEDGHSRLQDAIARLWKAAEEVKDEPEPGRSR